MSRRRTFKRGKAAAEKIPGEKLELHGDLAAREKYFDIFLVVLLFAFGVYHSVLYFGHQVVPNPDFTAFVRVGHQLLSFQLPTSYKRAPVLGLLQAGLSYLVGGQHPDLTAGWLLNAILHPFNIVLLWLVGKRVVGRAAVWIAVVAMINPWVIQMLADPIVETTLLFFVLLTFYFIFRRSRWSYFFASITTMVRYEGAALILAAFVLDMISSENRKRRFLALVYAAAAGVPLTLWMLGTLLSWQGEGDTHYLKVFGLPSGGKFACLAFVSSLWRVGFSSLFMPSPAATEDTFGMVFGLSRIVAAGSFIFGTVYGLKRREWNVLALNIFFLPYVFLHSVFTFVLDRFSMPVSWIAMLVCLYGLISLWGFVKKNVHISRLVIFLLQGLLLVLGVIWFVSLLPYMAEAASVSQRSASVPYIAIGVVCVFLVVCGLFLRWKYLWRDLVISVFLCLMIVSNQFLLVQVVGSGQRDIEFKKLADWYIANAKPGEKMATTMPGVVSIFAPAHKDCFLDIGGLKAQSPDDFVRKCFDKDITYVAWDSRIGLNIGGRYYKLWGIENIRVLARPQSIGPYEFITQIRINERQFINIFRLRKPPALPAAG